MFINEQIRAKEVMVIGPNGEQLGVKPIKDALTLANYAGFDLVLINQNSNPQVCKIMDYNKFKYENKKRQKENLKKQREANLDMKEYRLSVTIDVHDFNTRVNNSRKYLEKGHKIRFADALGDVSIVESQPTLDGRVMVMILAPKKEK